MIDFCISLGLRGQLKARRARLHRMANAWCGDTMLADDLTQDCLASALAKHHQLKDSSKMDAWLFRILHNCWMMHLRKQRPSLDIDNIDIHDDNTPETRLHSQEIAVHVRSAVRRLPPGQRQVATLVDLEECRYAEVAEILDIPVGTVMSRLNRARAALRRDLTGLKQAPTDTRNHLRRVK